jgi:hypothetical protein
MKLAFDLPNEEMSVEMLERLGRRIREDIDQHCVEKYSEEHRNHLGASVIGHDCARFIWYAFRWAKTEYFNGRMLRLFNRGNKEEQRFIEWLRGIGFNVWDVDPFTQKQYRLYGAEGHYGGSSDAIGTTPYPELINLRLLLELKTHNRGSFSRLIEQKLKINKPRHYSQMCAYGKEFGFKYGAYFAINKDDDDIHVEIVKLDWGQADDLRRKAEDIIFAEIPPTKVSMQATYYECKYCAFRGICHFNEAVDKNCRSCRYAKPVQNGQWHCGQFNQLIPAEFISKGCERHTAIG